ncbi:MAG: tyrosine protein phosphatase [Solirubrobacteraceae bacterium]|nr:tyrosine protein phosphatase [Solirubrobacteraceae bacterium]
MILDGAGRARIELHFHLLPGVDDGPQTMEESLELARLAVADGTRTITVTPHARFVDVRTVPERTEELRAALRAAGIPLEVRAGVEVAQEDDLDADELEIAAQGPPGRRWILLEAPLVLDAAGLLDKAAELAGRGYGLLIGHPERCAELMEPGGGLDELLTRGALLQLNASSVIGRHGERVRADALELARSGRAAVVASDAHRPTRGPALTAAVAALVGAGLAPDAAERMVSAAPAALLERGLAPAAAPRR